MKSPFVRWITGGACALMLGAVIVPALAGATFRQRSAFAPQPYEFALTSSIFFTHHTITTIGSTVDPINGDQNPYGLAIVPSTTGSLTAGDLIICNFNNKANVQGTGTTVELLHPVPGSHPRRFAQSRVLNGCAAVALSPADDSWFAAYSANDNPIFSSAGQLIDPLRRPIFDGPFGEAFSGTAGPFGFASFFVANAKNGSIVRINITKNGLTFDEIVTGLDFNGGVPGSILAPSGLTYDPRIDTLYVIDGNDVGQVYGITGVSRVRRDGIHVSGQHDFHFSGPDAGRMRLVFVGPPLNAPISAAELFNGDLVVGNTGDNRIIQINPRTRSVVGMLNTDNGPAGALFGIAASGTSAQTTKIYFNDDNDNTVKVITR